MKALFYESIRVHCLPPMKLSPLPPPPALGLVFVIILLEIVIIVTVVIFVGVAQRVALIARRTLI